MKSLLDTPASHSSFPGRWTAGEERFRSGLETLQRAGLIATDSELGTVELSAFATDYLRELRTLPESQASVFILRPFGTGFDLLDRDLIAPGLHALGIVALPALIWWTTETSGPTCNICSRQTW